VRREQDAARQIAALDGLLSNALSLPADQQDAAAKTALPAEIGQLRQARTAIREEIGRRFPDYVNLIEPKPATIVEVQAALKPGEALIATYVANDRTFVWAVPRDGRAAFTAAPFSRAEIARMVAELRKALEPNASTLGEIPPFDVALAHKLYAGLLAPVSVGWKGAKNLLVVPDGALGQLPLALLVTAPSRAGRPNAVLALQEGAVAGARRRHHRASLGSIAGHLAPCADSHRRAACLCGLRRSLVQRRDGNGGAEG
jgi:CHAT domain-containing protein